MFTADIYGLWHFEDAYWTHLVVWVLDAVHIGDTPPPSKVRWGLWLLWEPVGSHHQATQGTHLQPPTTIPLPQTGVHNSQSKLTSQIAVRQCQIQWQYCMYWQPMGTYHAV